MQLAKAGSNLAKLHEVEFMLLFPTEAAAMSGGKDVAGDVDDVNVRSDQDQNVWTCLAKKRMVPDLDRLVRLRKRFSEVARVHDGHYDGWGTAVTK
jgi:hypothetical protein